MHCSKFILYSTSQECFRIHRSSDISSFGPDKLRLKQTKLGNDHSIFWMDLVLNWFCWMKCIFLPLRSCWPLKNIWRMVNINTLSYIDIIKALLKIVSRYIEVLCYIPLFLKYWDSNEPGRVIIFSFFEWWGACKVLNEFFLATKIEFISQKYLMRDAHLMF